MTRVERLQKAVVREVADNWRFILPEPLRMIAAWVSGDRMLFVYQTPLGLTLGSDCGTESPIGTSAPTDAELAQEIAFYRILEPHHTPTPCNKPADYIHWDVSSTAEHPPLVSSLSAFQKISGQ